MQYLKSSFDDFFSGEAKVAVIKGNWGVGKTFFWNSYIEKRIKDEDLNQIAYAYVSLFGKTSLSDVKKSLFHSAKAIGSDSEIETAFGNQFTSSSRLLDHVPWMKEGLDKAKSKTTWLNIFTKHAKNIPVVSKFSDLISSLEYSLVNNYVVCFDDLERKGNSLTVKEIMGLIDELAVRKNCKIILIFNESSLDRNTDKKEFDSYREKVVDIELSHEPTSVENMGHVFPDGFKQLPTIVNVVNELDIKNIRVLKKIRWMIDDFVKYFDDVSDSHSQEFLTHAVLLCWGYFIRDENLSFETLKFQINESPWTSLFSDKEKEKNPGEEKYREIAINLKLSTSYFDPHIVHYLEHGFINEEALKVTISDLRTLAQVDQVGMRLRKAWAIYTDSFEDNLPKFMGALKKILEEDIANLQLSEFSSAIDVLEEFGESVSGYIVSYLEIHKKSLKVIDPSDSWDMHRVKNDGLRAAISKIHPENKSFNINDVAEKIAANKGWNREDIDYLLSLDKDDFYRWMKGSPDNLRNKIKSGLLIFRELGASDASAKKKYESISSNVTGALKEISAENDLNKKRIKILYDVE